MMWWTLVLSVMLGCTQVSSQHTSHVFINGTCCGRTCYGGVMLCQNGTFPGCSCVLMSSSLHCFQLQTSGCDEDMMCNSADQGCNCQTVFVQREPKMVKENFTGSCLKLGLTPSTTSGSVSDNTVSVNTTDSATSKTATGVIVASVVGGIGFAVAVVVLLIIVWRLHKKKSEASTQRGGDRGNIQLSGSQTNPGGSVTAASASVDVVVSARVLVEAADGSSAIHSGNVENVEELYSNRNIPNKKQRRNKIKHAAETSATKRYSENRDTTEDEYHAQLYANASIPDNKRRVGKENILEDKFPADLYANASIPDNKRRADKKNNPEDEYLSQLYGNASIPDNKRRAGKNNIPENDVDGELYGNASIPENKHQTTQRFGQPEKQTNAYDYSHPVNSTEVMVDAEEMSMDGWWADDFDHEYVNTPSPDYF